MFFTKKREYPIIDTIYKLTNYGELLNNTFDGGEQLFLGKNCRHIYVDLNRETLECYSICVILDACSFSVVNYNFKHSADVSLFYKPLVKLSAILACEDFILASYVDYKNGFILFGDISAAGDCYQFFKDTYCIISNNEIKLFFIKVEVDVLKYIKSKH